MPNQKQLLTKLIDEINKDFTPKGSHKPVASMGDDYDYVKAIPTFSPTLDYILGIGGWPEGKLIEIFGKEHCLSADTQISYHLQSPSGKSRNTKGGTIENLYYRFNKIPIKGQGNYHRPVSDDSIFTAPSMADDGHIFHNQIVGVIDSGVQECFQVITDSGEIIEATSQHRFFTGDKYSRLENLFIGDTIYIHNNTPFRKEQLKTKEQKRGRKEVSVKHHPHGNIKIIEGKYEYRRIPKAKAILEAHMNGLSFEQYCKKLNDGDLKGLIFIDPSLHVHHKDGDHTHDVPENLVAITQREHRQHHANARIEELSFIVVPTTIKSIKSVGGKQTYDVQMLSPHNNFVANKFVVHNSGKSTMAVLALKDCFDYYKGERLVGYIDVEHRFNKDWAEKLGFKVDENFIVIQPADAESGTDIMTRMIKSDMFCAIVWDSIGAAGTIHSQQELTDKRDKIGGNASVMKRCVQTNGPLADLYDVTLFMINQLRDDIQGFHQLVRPGGHAVKHQMSVVLYLRPGTEKYFDKVNGEDLQVGFPIMIKTLKNSYGPPLIQGWTDFYNQPSQYLDHVGIDYEGDLYRISILLGVVKKAGSWFSWKDFKEQGADKLLKAVVDSNRKDELLADVKSAIQQGRKRDRNIEEELESEFGKKLFDGPDINDPEI